MKTILFAVLAMLLWGIAPIFGKLGLVELSPFTGLAIRSFIISGLLLVYGLLAGKFSGINEVDINSLLYIATEGIFASLLGHLAYFYALKFGTASRVVPFVAAYPLVTVLAAIIFLKEGFSWENLIGALLIIIGIFIIKR